jgi:hypothetical protein
LKEVLNTMFEQFRIIRNKIGKSELGFENDKEWIESFNRSPEINKKIYVRIIIDQLKSLHNILMTLKTEKNS